MSPYQRTRQQLVFLSSHLRVGESACELRAWPASVRGRLYMPGSGG